MDFGHPRGSEPGYRRPALVISSNRFNRSGIRTVIVATVTSNMRLAEAPGNVTLEGPGNPLPKPSVVNVSQVLTANRAVLDAPVGAIAPRALRAVDDGLRLVLHV
ncbi:MAG: type II toxin-antitoxin system PemK/MazF family toxin [Actinomycetota bacterium]|nr:type II toxin-antitoxin system PemK/MazF family toxin [Actinomycetota bacterium]